MKILFTGPSSFSGMWFIKELVKRGHSVIALLRGHPEEYQGIRKIRIEKTREYCTQIYHCQFGTHVCLDAIEAAGPIDLFCHHAADVSNYKSIDFDYIDALKSNTLNIKKVLEKLKEQNCNKLILTGSVFEPREGLSSGGAQAVSTYGLSKGLTSDAFEYFSKVYEFSFGKFVIPNPFGPFEEGRFTTYLAKCWLHKTKANVDFPSYVRDNFPISLLAKCYAAFAEALPSQAGYCKLNPSFRPENQGVFVAQFASEMQKRWNIPCKYFLHEQLDFPEPRVRINSDPIQPSDYHWNESLAWDELADYYLSINE